MNTQLIAHKYEQRGFTLIEMLVAIAVLAISIAVATPSFRAFTVNQNLRTASMDLVSDLILARNEAVKRNGTVTIVPINNDWREGWQVVHTASATLLSSAGTLHNSISTEGTPPASIAFDANGRVAATVQLGLTADQGAQSLHRCVELDPSGRPRVVKDTCS
jgi:type IV fimbrial biogenesis protein FimT